MPEIIREKVSVKARSDGQFIDQYRLHGKQLPAIWALRRTAFINRMYAAYKIKKTRRRYLALICWAFDPQ